LGFIGDSNSETVILLANLLRDESLSIAGTAAVALGRIGTPAAARELRRGLDDPKSKVSEFTVTNALASIGEAAVPDLIESLQPTHVKWREQLEWPRGSSIQALSEVGKAAVPALLKAVRKRPGAIRSGSARALGRLGAVDAVPDLLNALVEEES